MNNILRLKREEMNLTQNSIAKKVNVSVRGYQKIESGECYPNVLTAQMIATVLNSTVEELFPLYSNGTNK